MTKNTMFSIRVAQLQAAVLLILLLSLLPVSAQDGTAVSTVTQASQVLVDQQDSGLDINWSGLGRVAGEMVDATFTNTGEAPMTVNLIPGMILSDIQGETQPIMLEDHLRFTLQPGERIPIQTLRAYCLDHAKEPPALGKDVDYKIVTDLSEYVPAVKQLWAGLRLDSNGKYTPVLKPLQHRTLVIQRSIWASLGDPNPTTQATLTSDLMDDTKVAGHAFTDDKVRWMADRIWADVSKTMEAAAQE